MLQLRRNFFYKQTIFLKRIQEPFKIINYKLASDFINTGIANLIFISGKNANHFIMKWYQSANGYFIWLGANTQHHIFHSKIFLFDIAPVLAFYIVILLIKFLDNYLKSWSLILYPTLFHQMSCFNIQT